MSLFRRFGFICSVITVFLLTACGPSMEDAKKLGFESVEQMETLQKKGFNTKNDYNKKVKADEIEVEHFIEQSLIAFGIIKDTIDASMLNMDTFGGNDPIAVMIRDNDDAKSRMVAFHKVRKIFDSFNESPHFAIKDISQKISKLLFDFIVNGIIEIKNIDDYIGGPINNSTSEKLSKQLAYTSKISDKFWESFDGYISLLPYIMIEGMDKKTTNENAEKEFSTKLIVSRKFINETKNKISIKLKKPIEELNQTDPLKASSQDRPFIVLYQFINKSKWKTNDEL